VWKAKGILSHNKNRAQRKAAKTQTFKKAKAKAKGILSIINNRAQKKQQKPKR
jgi:hypothetical protein